MRDFPAEIASFSFCLRAVILENKGAVLPFPRLLYEGIFQKEITVQPTNLPLHTAIKYRNIFVTPV